jgi:hypothetical protein
MGEAHTHQKVVLSTTIFTVPGNLEFLVNASSTSMGSRESLMLTSDTASSVSTPSRNHGGDPAEERKIPAAAACVSVGELRDAVVMFDWPRELRAMRMCDGLVVIADCDIRSGVVFPSGHRSDRAYRWNGLARVDETRAIVPRPAVAGPSPYGYDTLTPKSKPSGFVRR